jgi:ankyrin repeat protein
MEIQPASKKIKTNNLAEYNPLIMSSIYKTQKINKIIEYIEDINYIENQHNIISLFIKEHTIYTEEDLIKIIDFFIEKNIKLDLLNEFNYTPLIVCINNKFTKLAKILIEKEIGIYLETATLFNAIIYKNQSSLMKLVLEKKVSPNVIELDMTPLMIASYHRKHEMVKLLLDSDVDYNYINCNGENAMFYACNSSHNNSDPNFQIINMLIEKKVNLNIKNKNGETSLFYASRSINRYTHLTLITLLEAGANPNLTDNFGNNPLMVLINDNDNMNQSILMIIPIIITLINAGLNINHKNNMGQSVFDMMDNEMFQYYQLCSNYMSSKINHKIYINKECLICLEESSKMVLFDKCNHCVICFKCFQNLVNHHLDYIDIKCPYCNIAISTHTIIETI